MGEIQKIRGVEGEENQERGCSQANTRRIGDTLLWDDRNPEYNFHLNICLPLWNSCYHPVRYFDYLLLETLCCPPSAIVSAQISHETGKNSEVVLGQGSLLHVFFFFLFICFLQNLFSGLPQ